MAILVPSVDEYLGKATALNGDIPVHRDGPTVERHHRDPIFKGDHAAGLQVALHHIAQTPRPAIRRAPHHRRSKHLHIPGRTIVIDLQLIAGVDGHVQLISPLIDRCPRRLQSIGPGLHIAEIGRFRHGLRKPARSTDLKRHLHVIAADRHRQAKPHHLIGRRHLRRLAALHGHAQRAIVRQIGRAPIIDGLKRHRILTGHHVTEGPAAHQLLGEPRRALHGGHRLHAGVQAVEHHLQASRDHLVLNGRFRLLAAADRRRR